MRTTREKGVSIYLYAEGGVTVEGTPGGPGGAFILQVTPPYFLTEIQGSGVGPSSVGGGFRLFWPIPYVYVFFSSFYHFSPF